MGKPFASELSHLTSTLDWVQTIDVSPVTSFIDRASSGALIIVGAGGSYTSAELARLLFEDRGGVCVAVTPLGFLQNRSNLRDASVLLFTAGGNNRDVLATLHAAVLREARNIFVICGSAASKIEKYAAAWPWVTIFSHALPSGKDGYLATNSLAAFSALIIGAFGYPIPPRKVSNEIISAVDSAVSPEFGIDNPQYYLAVYADWARPAAVDLESKFGEAGLGGVILCDYRNFAHGRHNWIDKNGADSIVIAFVTPESTALATKTLRLLPPHTRLLKITTETPGATGALELILKVFRFTAFVGERRGIDPGRPGVPSYGSRIYHLGPVIYSRRRGAPKNFRDAAVARKIAARSAISLEGEKHRVETAYQQYMAALQAATFGALVVDFDGTVAGPGAFDRPLEPPVIDLFLRFLDKEIPVYFATGRGDSIHGVLEASFASTTWSRIHVSYYNGALTLPLSESAQFAESMLGNETLNEVFEIIEQDSLLAAAARCSNKGAQITVRVMSIRAAQAVAAVVQEIVANYGRARLRVVQSSHSIDVIPIDRTKLVCVDLAKRDLERGCDVMTIGDRGSLPGNDFDLLTHDFSLSVDMVSAALDSCWNILPPGSRNIAGFLCYGSWLRIKGGRFAIKVPKCVST